MRRELVEDTNSTGLSCIAMLFPATSLFISGTIHTHVEVILYGKTEEKSLEDPRIHYRETMGDVSKAGGFQ